jgi:hypothetical protein
MNQHYLELLNYLSEVETTPEIVFDPNHCLRNVFMDLIPTFEVKSCVGKSV